MKIKNIMYVDDMAAGVLEDGSIFTFSTEPENESAYKHFWEETDMFEYEEDARDFGNTLNFDASLGKVWKWCVVICHVMTDDVIKTSYLGLCSYNDAEDFVTNSGYALSMLEDAE